MDDRRTLPREKQVEFHFDNGSSGPITATAKDASQQSACFQRAEAERVLGAKVAEFQIGGSRMRAADLSWRPEDPQRPDVRIVEYDARSAEAVHWGERAAAWFERSPFGRSQPHRLYSRASFLRRAFGRVSRIHLYEAQEHFVYLEALVDFYGQAGEKFPDSERSARACLALCRRRLERCSVLLSRLQQDLNFLWREMAQVYSMMLVKVIPNASLSVHLDFCAEEAKRLQLDKDSDVTQMLQRLAELKDSGDAGVNEMRRLLRALVERFTRVRTGRIHDQFVNVSSYRKAVYLLAPIALVLILNADLVVGGDQKQVIWPAYEVSTATDLAPVNVVLGAIANILAATRIYLQGNIIAFVFFAGLLGGFFSVTIRLRSRELVPGEDAYFTWYVLTKPWVGALGAAVLFVLLKAGFVSLNVGGTGLDEALQLQPGPMEFGFAFIAGFSERLVFPSFGAGSGTLAG